jgi:type III restriction enzyme
MQIFYRHEESYEPDFVVETKECKWLCEPKRASELKDETVLAKARAAAEWCKHASAGSDKPWAYLLIPHDAILGNMTLQGLAAAYHFSG